MRLMTFSPSSRWRPWADLSSHALAGEISHAVVVMPVAATEQHGPHLPLCVDSDLAEGILRLASERWSGTAPVLQLPLQAVGFSAEHLGFAGTLSLSSPTLIRLWTELGECVHASGARKLLIFNTHGGQVGALDLVARDLRQRLGLLVVSSSWFQLPLGDAMAPFDAHEQRFGAHAGQIETAMMLALRPECVDMQQAQAFASSSEARAASLPVLGNGRSAKLAWMAGDLNTEGAVGNAAGAAAAQGQALLEAAADGLVALVQDMHRIDAKTTLPI